MFFVIFDILGDVLDVLGHFWRIWGLLGNPTLIQPHISGIPRIVGVLLVCVFFVWGVLVLLGELHLLGAFPRGYLLVAYWGSAFKLLSHAPPPSSNEGDERASECKNEGTMNERANEWIIE